MVVRAWGPELRRRIIFPSYFNRVIPEIVVSIPFFKLKAPLPLAVVTMLCALVVMTPVLGADKRESPLPQGVRAVWDLRKAHRETTPTRERVCLNGLWRWRPAGKTTDAV